MAFVEEEDVRKQLRSINSTYRFDLNEFVDLSFIKKVCKDRPTKAEMREGLEIVFDALINHKHTLRNPPSFATQTWMNALHEMREGRPFQPRPSHQTAPAKPAQRVFVDTPARSVTAHAASTTTFSAAPAAAAAAAGRVPAPSPADIEAQQIAEAERLSLEEALNSTPAGLLAAGGTAGNSNGTSGVPAAWLAAGVSGTEIHGNGGDAGNRGGGWRLKADHNGWVHILGAAKADRPQPQQQQQQQQQQSSLTSPALSVTPVSTPTPSSGSALSSPKEQKNGVVPSAGGKGTAEPASFLSMPASSIPDKVAQAHQHVYADLAISGGPPISEARIRLAKHAGGALMASLKAKEAWRSGVRAFAKVASEGPRDVTPTMTKVEVELARSVHEEACNAVLGVLVNGEPMNMRNYLLASRQLGLDGWPTEGARTNTKVVAQMHTLLGVAASNIGDGVDAPDVKVMQALCQWLLDLVEDDHAQALVCAFVKARVEQAALRLTEFFGP